MWTLTNVLFRWRWLKLQYNSKNSIVLWSSLGHWRTFKMPFNFWARQTFLNNTVVHHSRGGVPWERVSAARRSSLSFLILGHHVDNNLPHVLVGLHVSVSLSNVLQAEHPVDHRPQGARLVREMWQRSVWESLHQVCFVLRREIQGARLWRCQQKRDVSDESRRR